MADYLILRIKNQVFTHIVSCVLYVLFRTAWCFCLSSCVRLKSVTAVTSKRHDGDDPTCQWGERNIYSLYFISKWYVIPDFNFSIVTLRYDTTGSKKHTKIYDGEFSFSLTSPCINDVRDTLITNTKKQSKDNLRCVKQTLFIFDRRYRK